MYTAAPFLQRPKRPPGRLVADAVKRRVDPTQTLQERRRFEADVVRRFTRLKAQIVDALVKKNVLGLGAETVDSLTFVQVFGVLDFDPDQPRAQNGQWGSGGGGGGKLAAGGRAAAAWLRSADGREAIKQAGVGVAANALAQVLGQGDWVTGGMVIDLVQTHARNLGIGAHVARSQLISAASKLISARRSAGTRDAVEDPVLVALQKLLDLLEQTRLPTTDRALARSPAKVKAFMTWLQKQQDAGILEVTRGQSVKSAAARAWTNVYVRSAYQKGLQQAAGALKTAGVADVPSVSGAFSRAVHADRVGIMYTRTFTALAGVTDAMDEKLSQVLAAGIAAGDGPAQVARDVTRVVDTVGITRARTLARTEIIAAHAEATLNSYEEARVAGVGVEAEWATADDDAVCPDCDDHEGEVYSIADARGMIPLHPNCRCAFLPIVDGETTGQEEE